MPRKPSATPPEPPFTIEMSAEEKKHLTKLMAYCQINGVTSCSRGLVMRTLLLNTEEGLEILGMVKAQAAREKEEYLAKRSKRG